MTNKTDWLNDWLVSIDFVFRSTNTLKIYFSIFLLLFGKQKIVLCSVKISVIIVWAGHNKDRFSFDQKPPFSFSPFTYDAHSLSFFSHHETGGKYLPNGKYILKRNRSKDQKQTFEKYAAIHEMKWIHNDLGLLKNFIPMRCMHLYGI